MILDNLEEINKENLSKYRKAVPQSKSGTAFPFCIDTAHPKTKRNCGCSESRCLHVNSAHSLDREREICYNKLTI